MSQRSKRHKRHGKHERGGGHFCWSCGRTRANERFSGRGHAHHVCRDCWRLGPAELAYRQAVRNIDRLVNFASGLIRRKQRQQFERFLQSPEPRIRQYAEAVAASDREERTERWIEARIDELLTDAWQTFEALAAQSGATILSLTDEPPSAPRPAEDDRDDEPRTSRTSI